MSQRTTLPQMGGKVLPRLENWKKSQIWSNKLAYDNRKTILLTISRHVESENVGGSSPHEPTLRDPPHGENLNVEPVLQSTGVKDGETPVNKKRRLVRLRALSRDGVIHPRWQLYMPQQRTNAERFRIGLSSKTRRQTPLQMKTSFYQGGEQDWCALPSRPLPLSGRA